MEQQPLAKAVSYDFRMILSQCLTHSEDLAHLKPSNNKWPKSHKTWRTAHCQKRQFYFHYSMLGRYKQPRMDNWSLLRQSAAAVMTSSWPKPKLWGILVLFDFAFKCLHLSGWSLKMLVRTAISSNLWAIRQSPANYTNAKSIWQGNKKHKQWYADGFWN